MEIVPNLALTGLFCYPFNDIRFYILSCFTDFEDICLNLMMRERIYKLNTFVYGWTLI